MTIKVGDVVNYHSVIGGEITSRGHTVLEIGYIPSNPERKIAWITGKSGCVALTALSPALEPDIDEPPTIQQQAVGLVTQLRALHQQHNDVIRELEALVGGAA